MNGGVAIRDTAVTVAGSHPMTIEQLSTLILPYELSGEAGTNRNHGHSQIDAQNDIAAIWTWLNEFSGSPETYRAYRKEVERFINWALLCMERPISSMTITDLSQYEAFLLDPQPHDFWIAPRSLQGRALRGSAQWRPFEKALSAKSVGYASVVLGALFNYLSATGYLLGNPYAARRLKAKKAAGKTATSARQRNASPQYLPISTLSSMFALFEDEISTLPADQVRQRAKLERMLFLTRFLANTGLRREEMANAVMSDIYFLDTRGERSWYLRVLGKGDVVRDIPLIERARAALERYRAFYDLPMQHIDNPAPLLLPLGGKETVNGELTGQTVYITIAAALSYASTALMESAPDDARLLQRASPHKFRHAFATILSEVYNLSTKTISWLLGHGSIETTALYLHSDRTDVFNAINKAGV